MENVTRQNILENLQIELEVDSGYQVKDPELAEQMKEWDDVASRNKIVLCGESSEGVLDDCAYIWVDPNYQGELSPGQRQLYEVLFNLQEASVYTLTTVGKLTQMMGLQWSLATGKRLENLKSLGAINSLKL